MSMTKQVRDDKGRLVRLEAMQPRDPLSRFIFSTVVEGESMTRQSEKDAADVNNIIRRFDRTGELPPARRPPQYADVSGLTGDLTEQVNQAQATLARARKELRARAEQAKADAAKGDAAASSGGNAPSATGASGSSTAPQSGAPAGGSGSAG